MNNFFYDLFNIKKCYKIKNASMELNFVKLKLLLKMLHLTFIKVQISFFVADNWLSSRKYFHSNSKSTQFSGSAKLGDSWSTAKTSLKSALNAITFV